MKKRTALALILGFPLLLTPIELSAGAYEQLQGMAGSSVSVPEPSNPSPADDSSSSSSSSSDSTTPVPSIFNLFRRDPAAEAERARNINEKGNTAFRKGNWDEAVREYRRALGHNPDDAVIRQNLKNAQAEQSRVRRMREDESRRAEKRRKREEFERRKAAMFPPSRPAAPRVPVVQTVAKPGKEVETLHDLRARIKGLEKKSAKTASDLETLERLKKAVVDTWMQGVRSNAVSLKERGKLFLTFDIDDPETRGGRLERVNPAVLSESRQSLKPVVDLLARFQSDKMQQAMEDGVKEEIEQRVSENVAGAFENMLVMGKISASVIRRDIPGAAKDGLDFLVGKIGLPQAGMAVEGGRLYAKTTFTALDEFMKSATSAVGGAFNPEQFWGELEEEMTTGQKVVFQWVGGHHEKN